MNDESDLKRLLYGDFKPTEKDRRLYELAKQYHDETEAYDQTVCSGRTEQGVAMPINPYQFGMINRNAIQVQKRLLKENPDIDTKELLTAIRRYPD